MLLALASPLAVTSPRASASLAARESATTPPAVNSSRTLDPSLRLAPPAGSSGRVTCPDGQRNAREDECFAAIQEVANALELPVRDGLEVVDEGAKGLVPSGCSYSRHSKLALFNRNPAGGSGSDNYELACFAEAAAGEAHGAPSTDAADDEAPDAAASPTPTPTESCEMELMGHDVHCTEGFYNGWNQFYASEAECTALCLAETRCRFAALLDGDTCSRYDDRAGNCSEVKAGANFRLFRKPAALHAAPCFSSAPSPSPPPSINICQPGGHVVLVQGERIDRLLEHMYAPVRRTIASAVSAVADANGCQLHVFSRHDWSDAWSFALGLPSARELSRKDLLCYSARYPDLQYIFGNDTEALLRHWSTHGRLEGRNVHCASTQQQQNESSSESSGSSPAQRNASGLVFIWVGIEDEAQFFANGPALADHGYTCVYYQTEPIGHGRARVGVRTARTAHAGSSRGSTSRRPWIQVVRDASWLHEIWDYSRVNVKLIREGLSSIPGTAALDKRVRYVPPGYLSDFNVTAPLTTTSSPRLLFMGKLKWRDRTITQMDVVEGYYTWTDEAWRALLREEPSVHVNLHKGGAYNDDPLEAFRMSTLLSMGLLVISQEAYFRDMHEYEGLVTFEHNIYGGWSAATLAAYAAHAQNATLQAQRLRRFQQRFAPLTILQNAGVLPPPTVPSPASSLPPSEGAAASDFWYSDTPSGSRQGNAFQGKVLQQFRAGNAFQQFRARAPAARGATGMPSRKK